MADVQHLPELKLLALIDEELSRAEAAAARSHLTRCFVCHRLYEGLRRESDVLRAAAAPDAVPEREVSRELGWVVAAGLALSLGLVSVRRLLIGMGDAAAETPMPDAVPVLSDLGFRLLSLLDVQQIGLQIAYGGIVIMTLIGIALASNAIRRPRAGAMPLLLAALLPAMGALSAPAEALEVIAGESAQCRIAPERVVDDDLLLLCDEATVAGTVRGDLYFAGRALIISGRVDGDVFGFGNEVIVDGSVGLSVRGSRPDGPDRGRRRPGAGRCGRASLDPHRGDRGRRRHDGGRPPVGGGTGRRIGTCRGKQAGGERPDRGRSQVQRGGTAARVRSNDRRRRPATPAPRSPSASPGRRRWSGPSRSRRRPACGTTS